MSGTDTAIAELNEPGADVSTPVPRSAACHTSPSARARRNRLVRRRASARRSSASRSSWTTGGSGTRSWRSRRRALPGRRVPGDRAEGTCSTGQFGEPDAAVATPTRRSNGPATRAPGAARAVRELRFAQRHHHRPVRPPLDATGPVTGAAPHPARRRRLRVGVDPGRRPRRGVLRPRARVDLRSGQPPGDQHRQRIGAVLGARSADAVLLLRGDRPGGRATVDSRRRRPGRRVAAVRLRHACSMQRILGRRVRGVPAAAGEPRPELNGAGQAIFRTSPTRWRTHRRSGPSSAGCCSGIRTGPGRRRLADSADPSDGRCRGWRPHT